MKVTLRPLSSISKEERLHTPGSSSLSQSYHIIHNAALTNLTDAQLLALILNESCVEQGKGFFCWFPEYMDNVMILFCNIELPKKDRIKR